MRTLLATLALAALTTVGGASPAGAYTGPECNEFWKATRGACRQVCAEVQLPRGISRGRCRAACNRGRNQFLKACKRVGVIGIR